jgi:cell division protein FtsX
MHADHLQRQTAAVERLVKIAGVVQGCVVAILVIVSMLMVASFFVVP